MQLFHYTIYDSCSEVYLRPFVATGDGPAVREFSDLANDPQSFVGKHPEHYSLWRTSKFDDNTGLTEGETVPECIARAVDFGGSTNGTE